MMYKTLKNRKCLAYIPEILHLSTHPLIGLIGIEREVQGHALSTGSNKYVAC